MIYKIKFICEEIEGFLREINIDSDASFLALNKAILDACHYPDDQMTSFYICDDEWERHEQITREDMSNGAVDEDFYVMQDTKLSEFIEDEGQKMEFVFDPFSNRTFYLTVRELIPGKNLEVPELVRERGTAPVQIAELDFTMPTPKVTQENVSDEIFGDEFGYGDDELDPEGFEISDSSQF